MILKKPKWVSFRSAHHTKKGPGRYAKGETHPAGTKLARQAGKARIGLMS